MDKKIIFNEDITFEKQEQAVYEPNVPVVNETVTQDINNKESVAKEERHETQFASGFPKWDLIPPQVIVRRKRKL